MKRAARPAALRVLLCAVAALALAGCAALPFGRPAPAAAADGKPSRALYRVEVEAPDELRQLLLDYLDLSRFQSAPDTEAIDATELTRLAAAAPAQARTLLETEGYFSAEVHVERSVEASGQPLLRVRVDPGPRSRVASVELGASGPLQEAARADPQGEAAKQLEALRRDWPLSTGEPFRQAGWSAAKNDTLTRLRAEGYPAATWEHTAAQVDATTQRVTLQLALASGPRFHLGALRIEGLEHYDEATVRHLAEFHEGQPYTEKTLLDFQERLAKSGLFEGAMVELDTDPAQAAAAPVRVRLHEQPLQQATVGVGVSANTGPRVTLEHVHRKPFGWNWVAKNKFELGADLKSWQGELLSHPLEGQYRNLIAGQAERLRSGDEVRNSWSARLGRTQDTARIERLYYAEYVHSLLETVSGTTSSDALSGNYNWVYRDLDSALLPTLGYTLSAQAGAGEAWGRKTGTFTGLASERGPFIRSYARVTGYRPLGKAWYAMARVEAGQVFARDTLPVPDTLLFRAGGDDSVRGYAYRALGPTVDGALASGRVMLTGSAEIARPISPKLPSVWWAAFFDAGNAANSWTSLKLARGYGLGLRWRSPVGPLRVDLAYGEEVHRVRLHVSVGIAF